MSAYGTDESQLLGHLDVSKSKADWSSLTLCPPRYDNEVQDKYLSFSGTPDLAFTIQIDSSLQEIKLNESITQNITSQTVRVFQFIPTEDISDTQLDVTVTSESADVAAYLKVSRDCKDVKDNIDDVDYKGESLRLSFAKKGRITLSKVSIPPLTDSNSSWFIGIGIKNATGNTPINATKMVTLELSKSFDYSYAKPITILVAVSTVFGLLVAGFAFLSFQKKITSVNDGTELRSGVELGRQSTRANERTPFFSWQKPTSYCELLKDWFRRSPKTYSYTTAIVGFVLIIGAGQFVFANWHLMQQEGDRDNCYYNDLCYRAGEYVDIPFNLMISNLVYMIHGLILAFSVFCMEAKRLDQCRKEAFDSRYLLPKQAFSIGYAFAWALIFEGGFSLVYHLCPSKLTFQFDTAFMFVIAGLTVILLYNGNEMTERSGDESPVGSGHFFLYILVPLYIFNYLGTLRQYGTGLPKGLEILFFIILTCWWLIISFWAGWKLRVWNKPCTCCTWKKFWFVLGVVAPVVCFFCWTSNLPKVFLFACIAESVIASLGKGFCRGIELKCSCRCSCLCCRDVEFECSCMSTDIRRGIELECSCGDPQHCAGIECKEGECLSMFQGFYVVAMSVVWGLALYYFVGKQTTDKVEAPETSRNLNRECEWLGFFDSHVIWHIFSSHGLLMMVYFVMFMSSE